MLHKLLLISLIFVLGAFVPAQGAGADEFCGDDPILLIGGIETTILVQIPVSAVPSVPPGGKIAISVEVPQEVEASIIKQDRVLKYPDGRATGIPVKTSVVASDKLKASPGSIPIKVTVYVPTVGPQFPVQLTVSTSQIARTVTGHAGEDVTLKVNLPK